MAGGNYAVNLDALDDKQRNVKSNRGAIVQDGSMIYLCITQNATVPDSARVFETLGADNAINIDGGGSSALWVGGAYKYGPGRNIPTAIILAP
jgi:exopolysaccharide biosynthesis protein